MTYVVLERYGYRKFNRLEEAINKGEKINSLDTLNIIFDKEKVDVYNYIVDSTLAFIGFKSRFYNPSDTYSSHLYGFIRLDKLHINRECQNQ